jgi:hypothetical protein
VSGVDDWEGRRWKAGAYVRTMCSPGRGNSAARRATARRGELQARRIKVDGRTVRSWIAGRYAVPEAVGLLLECWERERRRRR